jgi:putative hemolysin
LFEPLEGPALELLAIVVSIAIGVGLGALEAALAAFGEVRLLALQDEGGRDGRTASRVLREGTRFTTRLLTGRVVALVSAVGFSVRLLIETSGVPWWGIPIALTALALLYATLAVGVSALARARAATWTIPMLRILRPVELSVWPLAAPLGELVRWLDRRFPAPPPPTSDDHAVREVEHMIEKREESGVITEEFAELLLSVLEFKDTVAREVMVPRIEMKAIEIDTPLEEVLEFIVREGHSRYPVYRDRPDQIEGVLYAKDLFRQPLTSAERKDASLSRIIRRPVFFVAETHKIGQLLREMQSRRFHLAVVVDEFGGTSGIVTLEDILEEIVGEIRDEHDTEEPMVQELEPGRWSVDARISIYDLGEFLGADFEEEVEGGYDSLGGMMVGRSGGVPDVGASVSAHGFEFIVREADERRVVRVHVVRQPPNAEVHSAAE